MFITPLLLPLFLRIPTGSAPASSRSTRSPASTSRTDSTLDSFRMHGPQTAHLIIDPPVGVVAPLSQFTVGVTCTAGSDPQVGVVVGGVGLVVGRGGV